MRNPKKDEVIVIKQYGGSNILIGIFSEVDKALDAAKARANMYHGGIKSIDNRDNEILVVCNVDFIISLDLWRMNVT